MRTRPGLASLAMAAVISTTAAASTINTQLTTTFNALGSFNAAIDANIAPDAALAAQRLFNARLGEWQGTTSVLQFVHSYNYSLNDPGVLVAPAENRPLLQVDSVATLSGPLVGAVAATSSFSTPWQCPSGILKCSSGTVSTSKPSVTLTQTAFASPADVLGGFHVADTTRTEPLFPGVTVIASQTQVTGSLTLSATYAAKTASAYAADALNATAGAAAINRAARFGHAAADIGSLRGATYSDGVLSSSVADNTALEAAHAALLYSRDAAQLRGAAAQGQTTFASRSGLLRDLWDVTALGDTALGRSVSSDTEEPFAPDERVELAALQAVVGSDDDAAFLARLSIELGTVLVGSTQPLLVLDGAQFGAAGAQLRVIYHDGEVQGSDLVLHLPAAERHALMRASFDNLAVLSGLDSGLAFVAGNFDGRIAPGDQEYIGENFSGVLLLDGDDAAWDIQLNNFYSPQFVVLASWNVAAVPEPQTWLMLLAGLTLVGWRRRGQVRH
jgi:PEP-CTERM motif